MKNLILLTLVAFVFSSCATLFTGTSDKIYFETDPSKAKVIIGGADKCNTPCTVKVKRSLDGETVMLKKKGYETRMVELDQSFNVVSILNLTNLLGWGIDAASGSIKKYDTKSYNIELEKD